jgi:hypothetical protein
LLKSPKSLKVDGEEESLNHAWESQCPTRVSDDHQLERAHEMFKELARSSGVERLGLFIRLLASLANAPSGDCTTLSRKVFSLPAGCSEPRGINLAIRHITANFRDEIGLEDILRLTGMSKATFSRQFKKHYGKTFSEFLSEIRLQAAVAS